MALGPTPSQTVGPFFAFGLRPAAELVAPETEGALRIFGRVLDGAGEPVNDALVEVWQADTRGRYADSADSGFLGWGRAGTDAAGRYELVTIKPGRVPGGDGRPQAPHLVFMLFARGLLKQVITRMYFPDEEEANAEDAVLTSIEDEDARATLLARREDGGLRFEIRLQGDGETVFFG